MAKKLSKSQREVLDLLMERPRMTTVRTVPGFNWVSGASVAALVRLGYAETYVVDGERWARITQSGLEWISCIKDVRE